MVAPGYALVRQMKNENKLNGCRAWRAPTKEAVRGPQAEARQRSGPQKGRIVDEERNEADSPKEGTVPANSKLGTPNPKEETVPANSETAEKQPKNTLSNTVCVLRLSTYLCTQIQIKHGRFSR